RGCSCLCCSASSATPAAQGTTRQLMAVPRNRSSDSGAVHFRRFTLTSSGRLGACVRRKATSSGPQGQRIGYEPIMPFIRLAPEWKQGVLSDFPCSLDRLAIL